MKRQDGVSIFQCIYCGRRFYSSQAIAAHTRSHFKEGWVKGTPQRKFFVSFFDSQHDSTLISSIPQNTSDSENPQQLPPSAASSSRGQLEVPRHHSRLLYSSSLCIFKDSLTKEEEEVVLTLRDFSETGLFINFTWFIFLIPSPLKSISCLSSRCMLFIYVIFTDLI